MKGIAIPYLALLTLNRITIIAVCLMLSACATPCFTEAIDRGLITAENLEETKNLYPLCQDHARGTVIRQTDKYGNVRYGDT